MDSATGMDHSRSDCSPPYFDSTCGRGGKGRSRVGVKARKVLAKGASVEGTCHGPCGGGVRGTHQWARGPPTERVGVVVSDTGR